MNKRRNDKPKPRRAAPKLHRTTFRTDRTMDFFSEKELVTQTGHELETWPLVFVKEMVDNALDACEEAGIPPKIRISADASGITVTDNGPGLPEETLKAALDFTIRASSREAYVAPDRGAQGNALKTIFPMPRVVDPKHGKLIVRAHGKRHSITCGADPISQRAVVYDDVTNQKTTGTEIRIQWSPHKDADGDVEWPFGECWPLYDDRIEERFRSLVEGFGLFNPHANITLDWFGTESRWKATDPAWEKWTPDRPTSPHWYELRHMERLIAAYLTHDQDAGPDRLVSDLIAEFDGLSGSQKRSKVLADVDMKRVRLSDLVLDDRLDSQRIARLLESMQKHTRPIKPARLGIIGEEHLRERLLAMGVKPDSFRYSKKHSKDGVPWVLESAFGWLGEESEDYRKIFSGANWSAAIDNPFRHFGQTSEGLEALLTNQRAGSDEPIVFCLHVASPHVEYTDRGKSAIVIRGAA